MFDDNEISLPWPEIPIDQLQLWLKVRQGEPVKYMLAPIGKFPMLSTHKAVPGDLAFEWAEIPMEKLAQDLGVNDGDLVLYGLISAKTVAVLKEDGASLEAAAESVKDLFGTAGKSIGYFFAYQKAAARLTLSIETTTFLFRPPAAGQPRA